MHLSFKLSLKRRLLGILVPMMLGISGVLPSLAYSDDCAEAFVAGIQSHGGGKESKVEFQEGSKLVNNPSYILFTQYIKNHNETKACSGSLCQAAGVNGLNYEIASFAHTTSKVEFGLEQGQVATIGAEGNGEFKKVDVGELATLIFSGTQNLYIIDELKISNNASVQFAAGDYWIKDLEMDSGAKIQIKGDSSARVYVEKDLYLPHNALINVTGTDLPGNPAQLFLYGNAQLRVADNSTVAAIIYARDRFELGSDSQLIGAINGAEVHIKRNSVVDYDHAAVQAIAFAGVCGGGVQLQDLDKDGLSDVVDPDIDGDGIDNHYENLVATDPMDMTSVPLDTNQNGIPDIIENRLPGNACETLFVTGVQNTTEVGEIEFSLGAQLLNSPSLYLPTHSIKDHTKIHQPSCGADFCKLSMITVQPIDPGEFRRHTGELTVDIENGQSMTVAGGQHFLSIAAGTDTVINFNPEDNYYIGSLTADTGTVINLAAGNYWIEDLHLESDVTINVHASGTARLFIKNYAHFQHNNLINSPASGEAGDPEKLLVYGYAEVKIHNNATVSAFILATQNIKIDHGATLFGAATSNKIKLNSEARINYPLDRVDKIDFSFLCDLDGDGIYDGFDKDRDGDGINNDYEEEVGTDPNDPNSTPPDFDGDGIPDTIDDDRDGDGVNNEEDVFPDDPAEWSDIDGDGIGDNTDLDKDGDGISNDYETQAGTDPSDPDSTPPDLDSDGIPDSLDNDMDGDSYNNDVDVFPADPSEWADLDADGIGDNSDTDKDGDGISNDYELQLGFDPASAASVPSDFDADGIPDSLDLDRDGDGVNNDGDVFPDDPAEWSDIDGDGIGDNADPDKDGDGISNDYEAQAGTDPSDPNSTPQDLDSDGIPDSLDDDKDGDTYNNDIDAFPADPSEWSDLDGDLIGDNSDLDRDGDGINNDYELLLGFDPSNAASVPADFDADGIPDALDDDRDGDGVNNDVDAFPDGPAEWSDLDGDGVGDNADHDRDGDGISNDLELQSGFDPDDAGSVPPDLDGDAIPDALDDDIDGDGVDNAADSYPSDPLQCSDTDSDTCDDCVSGSFNPNDDGPDANANGICDAGEVTNLDTDGDGVEDTADPFPGDPNQCGDLDADSCDDCSSGTVNRANDGPDLDSDGLCDSGDPDRDGDGVVNESDAFPDDASEVSDLDGDGVGDNVDPDRDGDGVNNDLDYYPDDGSKTILVTVTIQSPASLITLGTTPVQINGTVVPVNSVLTVNGMEVASSGGTFSAAVSLQEGHNSIVARVATDGQQVTDSISVSLDLTPPYMTIESHTEGQNVYSDTITVTGLVNDIVRGTVETAQANVTVNGISATIANRSYSAQGIALSEGLNTLTVVGTDQVGNTGATTMQVNYVIPVGKHLELVSGQDQTATIGEVLTAPLVVRVLDDASQPVVAIPVVLRVIQGAGAVGAGTDQEGRAVVVETDAQGLASTTFKVGQRSGTANHKVRAKVVGYDDEVIFNASASGKIGNKVSINSGNNQRGAVGQVLSEALVIAVTDEGANVVHGARVRFDVAKGDGHFQNNEISLVVATDSDGRANAEYILGPLQGLDAQRISVTLVDAPQVDGVVQIITAGFMATAFVPADPGLTSIAGVVLDNQDTPLPGVTVRIEGSTRQSVTDTQGLFVITEAPVGPVHLIVDGSTTTVEGEFPSLSYNLVTIAGVENPLSAPIYMVKLDTENAVLAGSEDVTLILDKYPGFKLEISSGSATFPDGSREGLISVTSVNASKVPMAPPNGMQPQFIVTIQPTGTKFDPPARLTLPNVDGHAPGKQVEMYSYDHDLEEFVSIGLGTVIEDGSVIQSNPGVGVIKAGWHCGSQPDGSACAEGCTGCDVCAGGCNCAPPTKEACCKKQEGTSPAGRQGEAICCNGAAEICMYDKNFDITDGGQGDEIARACVVLHEENHKDNHIECSANSCNNRPTSLQDTWTRESAECDSSKVEKNCLEDGIRRCGTKSNPNCIDAAECGECTGTGHEYDICCDAAKMMCSKNQCEYTVKKWIEEAIDYGNTESGGTCNWNNPPGTPDL